MVSRFFGSSPFDDLVDRATSEYLPAGQEDLTLSLDVCDYIRGKQVNPRDAIRALKRRISHRNPNVQMLGLKLTDTCVKNGGHHFLVEVASRDFMDYLTGILNQQSTTIEVREKILALIQNWAHTFQSRSDLTYVCDVHRALVAAGHTFPKLEKANASMIDTMTPPDWTDSDVCERCRTQFTFTNRKHHCRNCGKTFCQTCSSYELPLPRIGIHQEVRVCYNCYHSTKGVRSSGNVLHTNPISTHRLASDNAAIGTDTTTGGQGNDSDDEDMKRAIELSLKESQSSRPVAPPPRQTIYNEKPTSNEEEDPDLAAAIAASLRETHISQTAESHTKVVSQSPSRSSSTPQRRDPNDLTAMDAENIVLFSTLVERLQATNGPVMGDAQVQALYNQIGALRPKLIKGLEESARKHRAYLELHEKLTSSQKLYDNLLKEQQMAAYHAQQQQQQQQQQLQQQQQQQQLQQQQLMQNGWPMPQPAVPNPVYGNVVYTQPPGPPTSMPYHTATPYVVTPNPVNYPNIPPAASTPTSMPGASYNAAAMMAQQQQQQQPPQQQLQSGTITTGYIQPQPQPQSISQSVELQTSLPQPQPQLSSHSTYTQSNPMLSQPMPHTPGSTGQSANVHDSSSNNSHNTNPVSTNTATNATIPNVNTSSQAYHTTTSVMNNQPSPHTHDVSKSPSHQYTNTNTNTSSPRAQHQHTPSNPFHQHQHQQQQQAWKNSNHHATMVDQALANAPTAPHLPPLPAVPQAHPSVSVSTTPATATTTVVTSPPPVIQQSPSLIEL